MDDDAPGFIAFQKKLDRSAMRAWQGKLAPVRVVEDGACIFDFGQERLNAKNQTNQGGLRRDAELRQNGVELCADRCERPSAQIGDTL